MKKVACVIAALLSLFILSGCIEVIYEITVDDNDAEKLTMRLGAPAMLAPYMGELIKDVQGEGFYVKTDTQGDKVWIVGDKEFKKGLWDIPALPGSVAVTSVTRDVFQVEDYILFKKYTLDVQYDYQSNKTKGSGDYPDSMFSVPVKFVVTLPGRVLETNAHEQTEKASVWNYVITQSGTITMKLITTKLNWTLISAIVIFATLLIGAVVFAAVKSSRKVPVRRPLAARTQATALPGGTPPTEKTAYGPGPIPSSAPTGSAPPPAGGTYYVVTLSMPADLKRAEKIIATLAQRKNKGIGEIVSELKAGRLTITFSDKGLLDKNMAILTNAGFSPKVTEGKR